MMATPNSDTKPTAADMLKLVPVRYRAQMPPMARSNTLRQDHDGVDHRVEGEVKQQEDQGQRQRDDDHQPAFAVFHLLELAAHGDEIGRLKEGLGLVADVVDDAGQVAVAAHGRT